MRHDATEVTTVSAYGSRTAVHAYGPEDGPGVLAVHGFRGTHFGLEPLAVGLASHGYRVHVPDLPGAGRSTPLEGVHDAAGYGRWLVELTQQMPRQRMLLGHSFGTVIVGSAIARGAEHDAAVLVNPILQPPMNGPRKLATAAARAYYALASLLPEDLAHRLLASRLVAGVAGSLMTSTREPALRKWIREEHLREAGSFASRNVVLESFAASSVETLAGFVDAMASPTLILGADADPLSPAEACTQEGSGLRSGTFHVFPNRGHLLPYEETRELTRLIAGWDLDVVGHPLSM
ncbi:alpha/beta fold hydrolase [Microbacterium oxydans]|uniref:alpha/beta fold hydrolase n=1 Tax=Microbacterium oxydans TaxID=82380 RepID=UPI00226B5560|nr:alpha/beta fold hydrolase [Microbacterium oxydans]WAA65619.1 alpha/beta hydrolase [Microbacterium oxydans]